MDESFRSVYVAKVGCGCIVASIKVSGKVEPKTVGAHLKLWAEEGWTVDRVAPSQVEIHSECPHREMSASPQLSYLPALDNQTGYEALDMDDQLIHDAEVWLLEDAKETVTLSGVQRQFAIGFPRADWLLRRLEERGSIGPANNKPEREVLLKQLPAADQYLAEEPEAAEQEISEETPADLPICLDCNHFTNWHNPDTGSCNVEGCNCGRVNPSDEAVPEPAEPEEIS